MTRFTSRLELAMSMAGLSARELAKRTGFSEATISQYRSGYSKPRDTERVLILANALNVSPSWLLGYEDGQDGELLQLIESLDEKTKEIALDYIRYLKMKENNNVQR